MKKDRGLGVRDRQREKVERKAARIRRELECRRLVREALRAFREGYREKSD